MEGEKMEFQGEIKVDQEDSVEPQAVASGFPAVNASGETVWMAENIPGDPPTILGQDGLTYERVPVGEDEFRLDREADPLGWDADGWDDVPGGASPRRGSD